MVREGASTMLAPLPMFVGTPGRDRLRGSAADDTFDVSQGGHDIVVGGGGNDVVYFGATFDARDVVRGGAGEDTIVLRGDYSDPILLTSRSLVGIEELRLTGVETYRLKLADVANLDGLLGVAPLASGRLTSLEIDGSDTRETALALNGSQSGDDVLVGGALDDYLGGGGGDNVLSGGAGDDNINGSSGDYGRNRDRSVMFGDEGRDSLSSYYGAGHTILSGDLGDDRLTGDAAVQDTFFFHDGDGADTIFHFQLTQDLIWIDSARALTFSDLVIVEEGDDTVSISWGEGTTVHLSIDRAPAVPGLFLTAEDFRFGANAEVAAARDEIARVEAFGEEPIDGFWGRPSLAPLPNDMSPLSIA